jgi:hypothetical protein
MICSAWVRLLMAALVAVGGILPTLQMRVQASPDTNV